MDKSVFKAYRIRTQLRLTKTVVTVSQDETWKIETQPSQDVQVSRLKAKTHRQELQQVD